MRNALGLMVACVVSAALIAGVWFWVASPHPDQGPVHLASAPPQQMPAATSAKAATAPAAQADDSDITAAIPAKPVSASPAPAKLAAANPPAPQQKSGEPKIAAAAPCANPDALGIARTVEVDTTGGPGFGFQHFKQLDFLADKEIVLTFDDGPWPGNTPAVLKALADECTKAVFFPIGKHATYHPEILRQVAAAGHTLGSHTWSHANLNSKKMTDQIARDEIEKGYSAVKMAIGAAPSPFFRFPELQHGPAAMAYLGTRNVAMFSCDVDSFDFRSKDATQIINNVMTKLDKAGKGIILMHDFQKHTAEAMPTLLRRLKAGGYKVVFMKAKAPLQTLAEYDEMMVKDTKLPVSSLRPINSVVQTVSE